MPRPAYKELGISSKEYEEALLLERLFKLVKKNPCSTCLLKKPTHVDLDRYELVCTTCSKRCSSKVQIGKGIISMADLERLESVYDKSKKKGEHGASKHKKHSHKQRSPSLSSIETYDKYRKQDRYTPADSDASSHHRNRSKQRSKKKDTHRYQMPSYEHYPETYDKYPSYGPPTDGYPKLYNEDRYTSHHKSQKDKSRGKSRDRDERTRSTRRMDREGPSLRESHLPLPRDYPTLRDQDRNRDYPQMANYPYYPPPTRYADHYEPPQPSYKYPNMNRHQTAYEYTNFTKRDVPGMVGLLANKGRGQEMVLRNQWAVPALEDKGYDRRNEPKPQALALTNGYPGFRSVPPFQKDDRVSNNPFAKRTFEPQTQPYDFSNLRDALNPPKTHNRYPEAYTAPRDFPSNKLGNPGFPDSGPSYYNRY